MGAAAPIIGQVIVSFVVSTVATKIASKLGLSDSAAGLVGIVAGGFAAAQIPGGIGTSKPKPTAGMDLALPTPEQIAQGAAGVDTSLLGGAPAPDLSIGGGSGLDLTAATNAPVGPSAPPGRVDSGMLTQGANRPVPAPQAAPVGTPGGTTADRMIQSGTVPPVQQAEASWYQKLFTSEKTMDMLMAGIQGYSKAGMEEYKLQYPEQVAEKNAAGWRNAGTSGFGMLNQTYPSQRRP